MLFRDNVLGLSESFDIQCDMVRNVVNQPRTGFARVCADLAGSVGVDAGNYYVDNYGGAILCSFRFDTNVENALECGDHEQVEAWANAWPVCAFGFLQVVEVDASHLVEHGDVVKAKKLLDGAASEVNWITEGIERVRAKLKSETV